MESDRIRNGCPAHPLTCGRGCGTIPVRDMARYGPVPGTNLRVPCGMGTNAADAIVRHHGQRISLSKPRSRNSISGFPDREKTKES